MEIGYNKAQCGELYHASTESWRSSSPSVRLQKLWPNVLMPSSDEGVSIYPGEGSLQLSLAILRVQRFSSTWYTLTSSITDVAVRVGSASPKAWASMYLIGLLLCNSKKRFYVTADTRGSDSFHAERWRQNMGRGCMWTPGGLEAQDLSLKTGSKGGLSDPPWLSRSSSGS